MAACLVKFLLLGWKGWSVLILWDKCRGKQQRGLVRVALIEGEINPLWFPLAQGNIWSRSSKWGFFFWNIMFFPTGSGCTTCLQCSSLGARTVFPSQRQRKSSSTYSQDINLLSQPSISVDTSIPSYHLEQAEVTSQCVCVVTFPLFHTSYICSFGEN